MEKEKNKKNVVVTGLSLIKTIEPYKLKEEMDKFLAQQLQMQAEIKSVRQISNKTCIFKLKKSENGK